MVLHKRTRLTPLQRKALAQDYHHHKLRKADLCRKVRVSYPTAYKILKRARYGDYATHRSTNHGYRVLEYGLKRLDKIELKAVNTKS